jgi:hypothetical protein
MKTTLDIPDDLMREVKHRAVEENRKLKDMVAELLRAGLAQQLGRPEVILEPGKLPLIKGGRKRKPEEVSPERIDEILLEEEARWHLDTLR